MILPPNRHVPPDRGSSEHATPPDASRHPEEPRLFHHPQWMVGVVLILGVLAIVAGLSNPVWLLIGSPCILVLVVYIWVRMVRRS